MKPIVLKYIYCYFDTLKNKDAVKPFYQIITDDKSFSILSPTAEFSYELVDIIERDGENITFSFTYERYLHPDTSSGSGERVTDRYTLGRGESIECPCVRQARCYSPLTFINTPATLCVSYLDDEQILSHFSEMMKFNISVAVDYAEYLYDKAEYDLAFKLLSATKSSGSALGECFEYGRGTKKDSRRALECYIEHFPTYHACRGIERIIKETEGRDIVCDNAFVCVLSEKLSKMSFAYKYAKALSVRGTSTTGELRRSSEIALLVFLELGRPHNDPFGHPTPNMMELAQYFDMLDGVCEDERPLYYERIAEKDEYDGGYFLHDVYYDDAIVKTLLRHAERGEVLALGAIINQFPDKTDALPSLAERLERVAKEAEDEHERGLAYFFLGLYFERVEEDKEQAREYFERALSAGEHFAIIHLAEKYMEEDRDRAVRLIKEHHPFLLEKDYRGYPLPYSARSYISLVDSIDVWSEEQK